MNVASQDFRDGSAYGSTVLAERARTMEAYGAKLTPELLDALAERIRHDMGGANPYPLSEWAGLRSSESGILPCQADPS